MKIKLSQKVKKAIIAGLVAGAFLGVLLTYAAASNAMEKKESAMTAAHKKLKNENESLMSQLNSQDSIEVSAQLSSNKLEDWSLVLINWHHPLDAAYVPNLVELAPGYLVDVRIIEDARKMLEDAQAEGLNMNICSAYRSYEDQKIVFNDTMQEWVNQGYSYLDAYNETSKSVAVPGYSEHATGLALDITSQEYQMLDDQQAETAEAKWLAKNCYKYGFILRFPPEKIGTTGIVYEPWHYRYVGKKAAKEITAKNLTLEEYLDLE